jgi:hypothetical protein
MTWLRFVYRVLRFVGRSLASLLASDDAENDLTDAEIVRRRWED